jgi:hypothetical protein
VYLDLILLLFNTPSIFDTTDILYICLCSVQGNNHSPRPALHPWGSMTCHWKFNLTVSLPSLGKSSQLLKGNLDPFEAHCSSHVEQVLVTQTGQSFFCSETLPLHCSPHVSLTWYIFRSQQYPSYTFLDLPQELAWPIPGHMYTLSGATAGCSGSMKIMPSGSFVKSLYLAYSLAWNKHKWKNQSTSHLPSSPTCIG